MRGSIRKRGRTYTWYLFVPDPATGKPRQRSRGGYRTKRECQAGLNDALAALRAGTFVETSRRTIGSFVRDEWLPVMELNLRPTTWATYQGLLDASRDPHSRGRRATAAHSRPSQRPLPGAPDFRPTSSARRPRTQDGPKRPRAHPPGAQGRGALGLSSATWPMLPTRRRSSPPNSRSGAPASSVPS
jgi:hypothetical protein